MEDFKAAEKYVRAKRICKHANPLFEKWLLEWKTEAEGCKSNNKYNFQRAILSLRKFPLPVYSGDDCKILANFGDKICKMIDKKLSEFIAENGCINWDDYIKISDVKKRSHLKGKMNLDSKPTSNKSNNSSTKNLLLQKKSPKKSRGREYIPAFRSGAYALLIALMEAMESEDSPGYLKKDELIESAQPMSDASFTIPPMGSHYTAFSSMSTLVKKGLAKKEGNPARYSLTEDGLELAQKITAGHSSTSSQISLETKKSQENSRVPQLPRHPNQERFKNDLKVHDISSSDESDMDVTIIEEDENESASRRSTYSQSSSSSGADTSQNTEDSNSLRNEIPALSFVYIDVLGREIMMREKASVHIDVESGFFGFLIKCKLLDLLKSSLEYELDSERDAPPLMTYAYLAENSAPEMSPGLLSSPSKAIPSPKRKTNSCTANEIEFDEIGPLPKKASGVSSRSNSRSDMYEESPSYSDDSSSLKEAIPSSVATCNYQFSPGLFKVLLCVDNQEVCLGIPTSKKGTKEIIINELKKNAVDFHIRKLHVGDFLWVCQEISSSTGKPREMVLPFIIERKRMDDLAQSIKDGRFKEQKFRLKQTGLSNLLYLVEQFGSNYLSLPLSTCEQAVVNTQLIDNFQVKVTLDQKESAAYLTVMTRYLQSIFKKKTLHCISRSNLTAQELSLSHYNLVDFEELNSFSMKNRQLTIHEMFAKHLLQLSGLSVDKASAILAKYPTPSALLTALSRCSPDEKEKLLSALKSSSSARALGPALSSQLARLYSREALS